MIMALNAIGPNGSARCGRASRPIAKQAAEQHRARCQPRWPGGRSVLRPDEQRDADQSPSAGPRWTMARKPMSTRTVGHRARRSTVRNSRQERALRSTADGCSVRRAETVAQRNHQARRTTSRAAIRARVRGKALSQRCAPISASSEPASRKRPTRTETAAASRMPIADREKRRAPDEIDDREAAMIFARGRGSARWSLRCGAGSGRYRADASAPTMEAQPAAELQRVRQSEHVARARSRRSGSR